MAQHKERPKSVGTASFEPGTVTSGELVLAHHMDGPIASPVLILTGRKPGPTLWVQAAIHGTEIGGVLGVQRLFARTDAQTVAGAIVAITAANPLAFRAQVRNTPQDGENMNRCFPGTLSGTVSRQMAFRLLEAALATADATIDMHSGGLELVVPYYTIYWHDGSPASATALGYARASGSPVIWRCTDEWIKGGMFAQATLKGTPSLILECGGGGLMPEEHIESFATTIAGVARVMGILPGEPPRQPRYRMLGTCELIFNRAGGYFVPAVAAGDAIKRGGLIGRVIGPSGAELEAVRSPKDGYMTAVGRPYLVVHSGAMVAEVNDELGWEPAP